MLPLLTQESNSKARRGILRRAVFSEDQRKALEKMFQKQKYISKTDRKKLAISLGLKESQVLMSRKMSTAPDFCRDLMKFIHWQIFVVLGIVVDLKASLNDFHTFSMGKNTFHNSYLNIGLFVERSRFLLD